jgi:hypothetical protein
MSKTLLYVGSGILFLIGLCLVGYGVLSVIGSTSAQGDSNWLSYGIGFGCAGVVFLGGGAGLIYLAMRGQKTEIVQEVKIDLPGDTQLEEMKCRSCGGSLTSDNIKLVNGAPMVNCPYCDTAYQLTEEPKW